MQIRKATSADFPAVVALIKQFPEKLIQDYLPKPEEFTVAVSEERVIGCCALEVYSKRLAEIRSLAVSSESQGQGIASKLVESCLSEAKEKGIFEVLSITGSTSLFEKQGFGIFNNEKFALFKILG